MSNRLFGAAVAVALVFAVSSAARAHVTLEVREAPAGSYYKAAFGVGHGCGSSPTLRVRVRIPEGVVSVKPQPKPGWTLETLKGRYPTPIDAGHGNIITEGVREVIWSGRLLDEHFDQFVMQVKLPEAPPHTVLYFPVVQECEEGVHRWIEIPEAGRSAGDSKEPAPSLTLTPKR